MEKLKADWITDGLVDFEYKKYILLGYLQNVRSAFTGNKLYPSLNDLIFHYNNLIAIKNNKKLWIEKFPKSLQNIDLKKLKLGYKKMVQDDKVMTEIEEIIEFAIPNLKDVMKEGKDIYEYVESQMEISPVGISPLYQNEGYLFMNQPPGKEMHVYQYSITVFENTNEKYKGINTVFLEKRNVSSFYPVEKQKIEITKKYNALPNPATYFIKTNVAFPYYETFMPVAKRLLVRYISTSYDQ